MMKKIAAIAGAGAMLLSTATPAFATYSWGGTMNSAKVINSASSIANSGENQQVNNAEGMFSGKVVVKGSSNYVNTGSAYSSATAVTAANTQVGCSFCDLYGGFKFNNADVSNGAQSGSNSGTNLQGNSASGMWTMGKVKVENTSNQTVTGPVGADTNAWTVVNTNWSGFNF